MVAVWVSKAEDVGAVFLLHSLLPVMMEHPCVLGTGYHTECEQMQVASPSCDEGASLCLGTGYQMDSGQMQVVSASENLYLCCLNIAMPVLTEHW